jgi:hypothetical protein
MHKISIHFETIENFEPFRSLEIRAIEVVDNQCEWRSFDDPRVQFFSVYGQSFDKPVTMCIADCLTLESAQNLAQAFRIFGGHTLSIYEYSKQ